ncbi:MAG TPA: FkbM family methyltransferase [Humisphaera sp.]|nr:FkbM family methyltransferase [Humisphaera sp.]
MREKLISIIRRTPLEPLAFEMDERWWQLKGRVGGTFSQHGEDRIVRDYFGGRAGVYVDVGANYPIKISNTYLLYRHGWRGLTIEPNPRLSQRHRRFRPRDIHLNMGVSSTPGELTFYEFDVAGLSTFDPDRMREVMSWGGVTMREYKVRVQPLSELVPQHLGQQPVDLLSVDTEGHDLSVLQSADWTQFRPKLIIFEAGEHAAELETFAQSKGYRPYRKVGCNIIVERAD